MSFAYFFLATFLLLTLMCLFKVADSDLVVQVSLIAESRK